MLVLLEERAVPILDRVAQLRLELLQRERPLRQERFDGRLPSHQILAVQLRVDQVLLLLAGVERLAVRKF